MPEITVDPIRFHQLTELLEEVKTATVEARQAVKDIHAARAELAEILRDVPVQVDRMIEDTVTSCMTQMRDITTRKLQTIVDHTGKISEMVLNTIAAGLVKEQKLAQIAALAGIVKAALGEDIIEHTIQSVIAGGQVDVASIRKRMSIEDRAILGRVPATWPEGNPAERKRYLHGTTPAEDVPATFGGTG